MSEFLKMDIFFFVTTIVVLAVGFLAVLILIRVWEILGFVKRITRDVSEESMMLRNDIAKLRSNITSEGFKIKHLMSFFGGAAKRFARGKKKVE